MIDETLDIFDEQGALIGTEKYSIIHRDKSARVFEQDDFIPHYAGYYSDIMTKIEAYL